LQLSAFRLTLDSVRSVRLAAVTTSAAYAVSVRTRDAGTEREMPAPTQEQVGWDQALGSGRASLPTAISFVRLAEQLPRPRAGVAAGGVRASTVPGTERPTAGSFCAMTPGA
jgi:hypothetical protein